jgi:CRISPR-associated protein Cmx8
MTNLHSTEGHIVADGNAGTPALDKRSPRITAKPPLPGDDSSISRLTWTLHELPSSQHKAGLAGLALCVAFLKRTPNRQGLCEVESIDATGLTLAVDRIGMQDLFDAIYDASTEETFSKTKWADTEPRRVIELEVTDRKTGRAKKEKRFVYEQVVPRGALIDDLEDGTEGNKPWLKLWREVLWKALRAKPTTRGPYNARAERRSVSDGADAWDELVHGPNKSVPLPSTYSIGAQAKSAEDVPFTNVVRFRFLLHFWPFVAAIYIPALLTREGDRKFTGHALAIPEVSDLEAFVDGWPHVARGRGGELAGYYPRDAVVDVAGEGGLDVFRRCLEVIATRQGSVRTARWLTAVDVFHLEREDKEVRLRGIARIDPAPKMVDEYARVRGAYWSPVFRRQRIINLLEDKPWWWGFARLCAVTPDTMTIRHDPFQHDCRAAMTEVEMKQHVSESERTLEHLIYERVQSYVLGKTERKYELSWAKVQGNPGQEKDYREKKEKVGREAFLAVRSRTGADFVAYFTATICSVPHHATQEKYLEVARALMDPKQVERVRSLTLLALSAVS